MYYQVSYRDKRTNKTKRSSMIHTSKKAGKKEMDSKIKAGHKNVILLSGTKLTR